MMRLLLSAVFLCFIMETANARECIRNIVSSLPCADVLCPSGFKVDANGCMTCTCEEDSICQRVACPEMNCPFGFDKDAMGCDICECRACPVPSCSPGTTCPTGFLNDASGCPTCTCNPPACPLALCPQPECPYGYKNDANGCRTCQCIPPPPCPVLNCGFCAEGYVSDAYGCQTCQCKCPLVNCNCPRLVTRYVDQNGCWRCSCTGRFFEPVK